MSGLRFAFFGSSLVSSYWNGACTYYRGIIRSLHDRGHEITFYEPDAFERQRHRDIPDPPYARVVVYDPVDRTAVRRVVDGAADVDVLVKTSGVGVFDEVLEEAVAERSRALRIFWDVDAPATLGRLEGDSSDPLRALVPAYDLVLTYGGGRPVIERYVALGARRCIPIYNALDPSTHHPVAADPYLAGDLTLLANRLPDREERIAEFFLRPAAALPERSFLLAGAGWETLRIATNVRWLGHVGTDRHNALNCSALAVLNVSRDSMAANGWSPATRVFEAAGAGACLITDAWDGISEFFEPEKEILVADDADDVIALLEALDPGTAGEIGTAARQRALEQHTYAQRAELVEQILEDHYMGRAA